MMKNSKKSYRISVNGCDDSTHIELELTDEEFALIDAVARKVTNKSTYLCEPTMSIKPCPTE
jgi:hypothetical protein